MSYYAHQSYSFGQRGITKAVKYLLLVNLGFFLLEFVWRSELIYVFGLTPVLVKKGMVWQLVTYMFLHGGLFHILFNMFALWMFGCDIERAWGTREFVKYYFITGIGAGLFTFIFSFNSQIPTIGASGAIFGILVAFALMFPNRLIYVYFLFPVKAKYLVIFFAVIEFLASFRHTSDGIGHFAHLGGMVIGYLYIKSDFRIPSFFRFSTYLTRLRNLKHRRRMKVISRQRDREQKLMDRVDQILDKINQVGYDKLTKEEKKALEQASQILSKEREKG
ncbi:MAG: rhomboid family intramembrane serine protease [Candidatus Zixiibacteriota bacterium]|nr:MAG: rhomboid family intramembrane serine protease [candidate division Zixibacteria bacterium]